MFKRLGLATVFALGVIGIFSSPLSAARLELAGGATQVNFQSGQVTFEWEQSAWEGLGLRLIPRGEIASPAENEAQFAIVPSSITVQTSSGRFENFIDGAIQTRGAYLIASNDSATAVGNFTLHPGSDGTWTISSALDAGNEDDIFVITSAISDYVPGSNELQLVGEISLSENFAIALGTPEAAGQVVGRLTVSALSGLSEAPTPIPSDEGSVATNQGPDVIVGDLPNVQRWGRVNGLTAYSAGTTSCNIGTERVGWYSNTNNHPIIGQNLYRLKDGRFEQLGLSWLKHGFFALSGSLCLQCNDPTDGSELGVGCSDPYSSGLNGEQGNLGPRYQVNAATGFYPFPYSAPAAPATIGRRLQVADADIDPALNSGAQYFIEGHYVTPDDAPQGGDGINNSNNNASYRRVTVSTGGANVFNINVTGQTQREKPAILAWHDMDPDAKLTYIDVPNDGRLILGYKVTELPSGMWHYEFALQNLNSDRSGGQFSLPLPSGINVENIGFHKVSDHSGAPYDTSDWTITQANGRLTWATTSYQDNPNSNALRWGSMYNFRFDANAAPIDGTANISLFKPGTPAVMEVPASVPDLALMLAISDPPAESIDARQPSNLDGSNVTGWQFVNLGFNGYALNLQAGEFTVSQEGGTEPAPTVVGLLPVEENVVTAILDRPLSAGTWTTITHTSSGTSTRLGYLPGDVNGDGVSSPVDVLALIDALNGVGPERAIWSTDIDRSGVAEPGDILRLIDLLNGAGAFDVYNFATLPH